MMTPKYVIVLVLALSSMWVMSMAQTGVSGDCTNELVTLSPCLDYITGNSSTPTRSCCSQLANVVRSSPQCLCQLLNGGAASFAASLNINQTLALTLPNACNVQTPPLSTCNAGSPAGSPLGSPPGSGSRLTPTGGDSSDAKMSNSPVITCVLLAVLFVTSHALPSF
ncbi:non-specific lipid transfer protein GPI-anchored 5 [Beta vulgaris subsp. vulgaris]|uniref:non-specific lipid transfer protein GPI-anchored 5 n=1 Tax=Beta vulgaris subsp. vulgaris TaxID=3555 RepID=UPI002036CEA7|nr:non-specific lipid transfer protein GPI-anchored 5 [Beta vulgaris subsp. vulgaris]